MRCVYCRNLTAEDFYIENGVGVWVCNHLCLEGYLDEKWLEAARVAEGAEGPSQGGNGSHATVPRVR